MQSTTCKMTDWMNESQPGAKIARRNSNNFRYASC